MKSISFHPIKIKKSFQLFLCALAKKEIKSRRVTFFLENLAGIENSSSILKENAGFGVFRDERTVSKGYFIVC